MNVVRENYYILLHINTDWHLIFIFSEEVLMKLLDELKIQDGSKNKYIKIYHGDLTEIPVEEAVDILVVSAFPDDYTPTPRSLIGALHRKGVSVAELAQTKAVDLRKSFSCWMSQEINSSDPGIQFKRILCFEPQMRGKPSEVVGEIFQSLMPFVNESPSITSITMPLVATGDQGVPLLDILEPLLDAAAHWLALGLPVQNLKIVEYSELKAAELKGAFSVLKQNYLGSFVKSNSKFKYDLFISYSHLNMDEVIFLAEELHRQRPNLRIFLDRKNLNTGVSWQQELYDALDDCRKVVAVYSPTYLSSKVCKEEFNIAIFRHRDSEDSVLLPIYLYSTELPTYMKLIQFIDCREADEDKLRKACKEILASL
jgi:hypothetical protein